MNHSHAPQPLGYFGLLFAVHKLQNSSWALPGGAQTVTLALAATGATFMALPAGGVW